MNVNKVMIAGNLTRDPQVKFLSGDRAVCNFGLAINRRFKGSDGEQKEEAAFVEIEAWGRTAELAGQYLAKGRCCFIEGRLKLDQYEDKEGKKQSKLRVVADAIQFVSNKSEAKGADDTAGDAQRPPQKPSGAKNENHDEPPF
jgi:single-strand DNA-binding protein